MIAGGEDLLEAVLHLIPVFQVAHRDGGEADDGVHGRPDIVGHVGEEGGFGLIGPLGLHQRVLECLGLLPLLPDLIGDVLGHHHDHDVPRVVVRGHDEGLAHAHGLVCLRPAPVVHVDLHLAPVEALLQPLRADRRAVVLQGLLHDEGFPHLEAGRGGAGGRQPGLFQQGDLFAADHAGDVMLDEVPGEVELEGAEGGGGDGDAVLPLLAVHDRQGFLVGQLPLLQLRDVLADEEDADGPALLPLEAHGDQVLPVLLSVPEDVALICKGILVGENLRDGRGGEGLPEALFSLLPHDVRRVDADDVVVRALHGQTAAQGPDARHVGIRVALQVHREVAGGEEGVQPVQRVAELDVLLFQRLPPGPPPDQQNQDVHGEQEDQNHLQHHAGVVGLPEHGLGDAGGEGLNQNIFAVRDADHAQVVNKAVLTDEAPVLRAVLERLPEDAGGALADEPAAQQHVGEEGVVGVAAGAGDDPAVRGTQIGVRRFAEIADGQHVPEIVLREVQPQQHADDLAVVLDGGVKHGHELAGLPGPDHLQAAFPPHSAVVIVPVRTVVGPPVGGQIEPIGVGEADGVEGGVLLHPLQQRGRHLRPALIGAQQIGVVAQPQQGVLEFAPDSLGGRVGGIHGVVQVLALNPAAVGGGVPAEQQEDRRQQDADEHHVRPRFLSRTHKNPLCSASRSPPGSGEAGDAADGAGTALNH